MGKMNIYQRGHEYHGTDMSDYKYILKVNGVEVWEGKDPVNKLLELAKAHPEDRVSILWVPLGDDIIIV